MKDAADGNSNPRRVITVKKPGDDAQDSAEVFCNSYIVRLFFCIMENIFEMATVDCIRIGQAPTSHDDHVGREA